MKSATDTSLPTFRWHSVALIWYQQVTIMDNATVTLSPNVTKRYDQNLHPHVWGNNSANISEFQFAFQQDLTFQKVTVILNTYVIPVIIVMGFLGNTISFFIFVGTHLNRLSSSVYLAFLAAVDNLFLITLLFVWFGWVEIHLFKRDGWCQSIIYGTYVCSFLSVWTVLSFTLERYIVVFYPLRRHRLCTRKRAIITMAILTSAALLFYSFTLKTFGVRYMGKVPVCRQLHERFYTVHIVMSSLDTLIGVVIPTLTIMTMNTAIGVKVYNYTRRTLRSEMPSASGSDMFSSTSVANNKFAIDADSDSSRHYHTCRSPSSGTTSRHVTARNVASKSGLHCRRRQRSQMRITRALLVVSSVFLVLNLPSHAFRLLALVLSFINDTIPLTAYTWLEFLQFLYYLSFSTNFLLYMIFSRTFRNAFRRLLRRTRYNIKELKVIKGLGIFPPKEWLDWNLATNIQREIVSSSWKRRLVIRSTA